MTVIRRALRLLVPSRVGYLILGVIAGAVAVATILTADRMAVHDAASAPPPSVARPHARTPQAVGSARTATPPTAAQFGQLLVALSNAYGMEHGNPERLSGADCVQASSGHYMCSYAVVRPSHPDECHIIQAEWTPNSASSFRITLSGRVARCHTLREAIKSLK